jgi:hypothetical protein
MLNNGRGLTMKTRKILILIMTITFLLSLTIGCKDKSKEVQATSSNKAEGKDNDSGNSIDKIDSEEKNDKKDVDDKKESDETELGLLIGLALSSEEQAYDNPTKRTSDRLKTFWIYSDEEKFFYEENPGAILTASNGNFYELKNELFEMQEESGVTDGYDFYSKYNFNYSYSNISSSLAGEERKPLYTEESFSKMMAMDEPDWPFRTRVEWPSYIGDKYALLMSDYYETGGGTFRRSFNTMQLYEVDSLGKIYEREQTKYLFDLLDKDTQEELLEKAEKYNKEAEKSSTEMEKKIMDLDNIIMARKSGRWILRIPVFNQYYHEGNGSYFYTVAEYIDYECKIPTKLVPFDSLPLSWEKVQESVPEAIDAIASPDKNFIVILTSKELLVFNYPKSGLKKPVLKIPLEGNERIVLNQWSGMDEVNSWNSKLQKYFKTVRNEEVKNNDPEIDAPKQDGIKYTNDDLGFSFVMPKSWEGKYKIEEVKSGIKVFFKPTNPEPEYDGALFYILDSSTVDESFMDRVGEPRSFMAKDVEYIVGGPTDLRFNPDHKEFETFIKMVEEVNTVVATIK